ncbi:type II toxin-antitoxin system RelE family toxin [Dyadobacter luticola]|uniref:Type II toxin-antitoxin system RelE/ParE family toxin n=1 Tax=Dyadobacter luticola TaxID=1979387 RepID=A0A5R9KTC5_9BACT|nr:type II toxin-antitoxin system RelE/ParE family toxin [Dyadobacter luticola]TLU99336.1 type II toxin-antitoxin system RelE/ParE family toxin [Dyadobacter luticola]
MVVEYVKRFEKDLKKAPKDIQKRVFEVILKLKEAENLEVSGVDYKKMAGQEGQYHRIRVGDWRIGIEYIHPDVTLLRVLARGNVYKSFP